MTVDSISPIELRAMLIAGERLTLLDVREDHERALCAISPGAATNDIHIPMGQIPPQFDQIAALAGPIVVYCHHGVRSMVVAHWLASRGVGGLVNLDGGIDAWSIVVDPAMRRYS